MTETYSNITVLVADDDPDARALVTGAIGMLGCQVVEAHDGTSAAAETEKKLPDIAVLDMMMPGLTGVEVCQKIRSLDGGPLVPVIILTARDGLNDKVSALESGADDYLTKPFQYQELLARIKALLRVRELNLKLRDKNNELLAMQQKLIEQERQLVVGQLAGTAAHQLGQPLSAIMLNCHLLEKVSADNPKHHNALGAIKDDARRMAELIEKLKNVDASKKQEYYADTDILDLEEE